MRSRRAPEDYDVVVVGGGSAGVGASAGAARTGVRVCLIERYPFLGGAATASSVWSYCGFFDQRREWVVGGVGADLLARLHIRGACREITFTCPGNTVVMIDPEYTKVALDQLVADAGVQVSLHSYLIDAVSDRERVIEAVVADHGGRRRIRGSVFVDATGDGDLASLAGASVSAPPPRERQAATGGGVSQRAPAA
jgi:flavin-dependent dehydrogenase